MGPVFLLLRRVHYVAQLLALRATVGAAPRTLPSEPPWRMRMNCCSKLQVLIAARKRAHLANKTDRVPGSWSAATKRFSALQQARDEVDPHWPIHWYAGALPRVGTCLADCRVLEPSDAVAAALYGTDQPQALSPVSAVDERSWLERSALRIGRALTARRPQQ